MPKDWKKYERDMCAVFSKLFFGVDKPAGGRTDKDLPLCRADDSGSHPSALRTGDIVPNGKWIREGRLVHFDDFRLVIEAKYVAGIQFDLLLTNKSNAFFKYWEQAAYQAKETLGGLPLLVVNRKNSSTNYVVLDMNKGMKTYRLTLPKRYIRLVTEDSSIVVMTLADLIEANPIPPYRELIKNG